ncbi:IS3 family transposase, partial [Citrobacter freundii]|nr:IS3 family transposase [Citrobacter freundii]MEB0341510.1 IS3 family transposase [Citrobacter freundii]MEB0374263.1 IS3 family transposase [Citrobacter freundii]MEB0377972.1 IS3 family transposase [Citrobacter freundii]
RRNIGNTIIWPGSQKMHGTKTGLFTVSTQSFLKSHGLEGSMSRRGNCHDNAVAECFFQLLKRERIKKKIYGTREEARSDIFDYIEMFYNSKRRLGSSDQMPPTEYEKQYYQRLGSV